MNLAKVLKPSQGCNVPRETMKYLNDQYYHVYNRGVNREGIFYDHENYRYCLELMRKYASKFGVSMMAYCLMPNHYHFLVRQNEGGSISKFLQSTFNAYTQALNQQRHRSGTLFEGRAKGVLVDSDRYLFQVIRYIHLNPVLAKLVVCPEEWYASDFRVWIDEEVPGLTDLSLRDEQFGRGSEYKEFVEEYQRELLDGEFGRLLIDSADS